MLPDNKLEKQQKQQHTCVNNEDRTKLSKWKYKSEYTHDNYEKNKLTRTAHHMKPICRSIHEQNPTEAQLVREERILSQTLQLSLHK